jgi:release factor glutamine methyltransferase
MPALGHLVRKTSRRLEYVGIGDARLESDLLWMTALGIDRPTLYARFPDSLTDIEADTAEELIQRRLRREPIAYLMGKREFFGLDISIAPGVLIPRPETETVVEETLRLIEPIDSPTIADVGCGSGAISIAIAVNRPDATVFALDVSERALQITAMNAEAHKVVDQVQILNSDLLASLASRQHVIVANLPYVMSHEIPTLEPEIRMFEPVAALDGGNDGLRLIYDLLAQAPGRLLPGGSVILEVDPRQIANTSNSARMHFPGAQVHVVKDLACRNRVLLVTATKLD